MMKKVLAILGAAVIIAALGALVVGTVLAQDPTPTPGARGPRAGAWGGWVGGLRGGGMVCDEVLKLLGLTREQFLAERSAGKTLAQIAAEKGVSEQQVIDAMLARQKAAIDQAVKDGKITQAQADWLLARMKAMAPFELSNPFAPRGGVGGFKGGMKGGRGCWGKASPTPTATTSS